MRWVTFFPGVQRQHLTKDVGLLPYSMSQNGMDATLVSTGMGVAEADIPNEVRELRIITLPDKGKKFFLEKSFLKYLDEHANEIDVLNLFHLNRDTILYGLKFKKLNPKGFLYIKLDAYNQHLLKRKVYSKNPFKDLLMQIQAKKFYRAVDLFTIENTRGKKLAEKTYPEWAGKIDYLPNGCNDLYLNNRAEKQHKKEKIVLSVGRLGSSDKNYEIFLEALEFTELSGWKFRIIGPITEEFSARIEKERQKKPESFKNVEFTGSYTDRDKLYDEFSKASVFFLPSRFESFGIAFVEALFFGNVIVGHNEMAAFDDLSEQGRFGEYYEDSNPKSLAESLAKAARKSLIPDIQDQIKSHTSQNFYWSNLSRRLSSRIRNE